MEIGIRLGGDVGMGHGSGRRTAEEDTLSVDLPADAATLDPHVQWDTDSYSIYRNIFDNLLTRDADGKIVPQIAAAWRYVSDTAIDFDIRTDVKFHDGSPLTARTWSSASSASSIRSSRVRNSVSSTASSRPTSLRRPRCG